MNVGQRTVNVKDFGAVGDGVADDTLAIQKAVNSGNAILIPNGTYIVKATITLNLPKGKILGPSFNVMPPEHPVPRRREAIEHTRRKLGL